MDTNLTGPQAEVGSSGAVAAAVWVRVVVGSDWGLSDHPGLVLLAGGGSAVAG